MHCKCRATRIQSIIVVASERTPFAAKLVVRQNTRAFAQYRRKEPQYLVKKMVHENNSRNKCQRIIHSAKHPTLSEVLKILVVSYRTKLRSEMKMRVKVRTLVHSSLEELAELDEVTYVRFAGDIVVLRMSVSQRACSNKSPSPLKEKGKDK